MANIPQRSITKLDPDIVKILFDCLTKYGGVKIIGFGIFKLVKTKGIKNGVHPYTGKRQSFPPYVKITFKPLKALKDAIQKAKIK